jgi:taurine dioxygenase
MATIEGYQSIEVSSLTPHIGAEVSGLDLRQPLSNEQFSEIYRAWLDWQVLVFREQDIDRDQHKSFARKFGTLHVHPMQHSYGGDPEILTVKTTKDSAYTAGNAWHTDVTCDAIPPMASMLLIKEPPVNGGGDTMFANMYLAYDLLSDVMKELLDGLVAVHNGAIPYLGNYRVAPPGDKVYPRNEHPVIVTHPETGKKVLFVNSGFTSHIKGMRNWESRALLDALLTHIATTARLTCRVEWQPNTLTLWDNRCTQHHAVWDYWPESRYGERVSILGNQRPQA